MLLKNSLSGETGTRAENIDLHNRAIFNDLEIGKVSTYPEKICLRVFQQNQSVSGQSTLKYAERLLTLSANYDKLDIRFEAFISITAALIWLD
jgi:hypothetical protein